MNYLIIICLEDPFPKFLYLVFFYIKFQCGLNNESYYVEYNYHLPLRSKDPVSTLPTTRYNQNMTVISVIIY